ncbi:Hypothetical predicted protein [Mytilus galloprovincialis]|uniref:Uncharacterized protein n=1 Tax=Mytilus galloprovincialis TaxID=29158 RepID=A0A8B6H5Q5_MYTGA|nr:Hypothetical predicted protein [Mytilus galloprovincialis]
MASTDSLESSIKLLVDSVKEIKEGQDSMKRMFESKIDRLRNDVLTTIDEKMKALKTDIDLDIARESTRIDELVNTVQILSSRFNNIEINPDNLIAQGPNPSFNDQNNPLNNNEVTVIVKNLPHTDEENLTDKMNEVICKLGEDVSSSVKIAAITRLKQRIPSKPGLVKVSLQNAQQKIKILRNKHKLKNDDHFNNIFIQSAKSRVERLLETNTRMILRELPQGNAYRMTGNGRILRKRNEETNDNGGNPTENMDAQNSQGGAHR